MAIETRDLVVEFPGKQQPALDRISMTVADGSFAVFVGASGSGKTTLLHCMAGLPTPPSGTVTDSGESIDGPHPQRGGGLPTRRSVPLDDRR